MKNPGLCVPLIARRGGFEARVRGVAVTIRAPVPLLRHLLELCDGRTPTSFIVSTLAARWNRRSLRGLLSALERSGVLADVTPPSRRGRTKALHVAFIDIRATQARRVYRAFPDPGLLRASRGLVTISAAAEHRSALRTATLARQEVPRAIRAAKARGLRAVEERGFFDEHLRRFLPNRRDLHPLTAVIIGAPRELPRRDAIKFEWVESKAEPAFFTGMARLGKPRSDADYCWGRSRDPLVAYDKAIAEAVERAACEHPKGLYRARFSDLPTALDPRSVVAYAPHQYARRNFPYRPFDENRPVWWKDGIDRRSGKAIAVLADLVYFGPRMHVKEPHRYTISTSSGVAAAYDREKAFERAVLELIERDAFMRAWYLPTRTPRLRPETLPDAVRKRIRALEALRFRVVIKDLTRDAVPVILTFLQHSRQTFTTLGAAANYDAEAALDHALMEAEAIAYLRLDRQPRRRILPKDVRDSSDHGDLYAQPRYFRKADSLAHGPATRWRAVHSLKHVRTWTQLQTWIHRSGRPLIELDITPPGASLPHGGPKLSVVRAIVPGLVPIHFGNGRQALGAAQARLDKPSLAKGVRLLHPFA